MTLTLGLAQIIYIAIALGYVAVFFVGAAWGKRVGTSGGTIKGTIRKEMKKELAEYDANAQEQFAAGRAVIKAKFAAMKE